MAFVQPSRDEWAALYDAAVRFRDLAPWRWMVDADAFAVLNPERQETGYCSVLGALGEVFGLVVYRGAAGLDVHERLQSGEIGPQDDELFRIQDCLLISFEDRGGSEPQDRKVFKELGLKFRGRNAWPIVRSYLPNYAPWRLEGHEARFLTFVLEQALGVAERFKENPKLLESPEDGRYFARISNKNGSGLQWADGWVKPERAPAPKAPGIPIDEAKIAEIAGTCKRTQRSWEIDLVTIPAPIMDRERPYYARMLMVVERETGMILAMQAISPWASATTASSELLNTMKSLKKLPAKAWLREQEALDALAQHLERLDIPAALCKRLPALEEAQESLFMNLAGPL